MAKIKRKRLETLAVQQVPVDDLFPNTWNPNRQSEREFKLLLQSMLDHGFTQPVVALESGMIVDGEHRWRAAKELGLTEIPTVYVDMTEEQMRVATMRLNEARGTEDVDLTAAVIRDLQELGALDKVKDSLDLSDAEIDLLLGDVTAPDALAAEEFSQAWEPDSQVKSTRVPDTVEAVQLDKRPKVFAATPAAIEGVQAREQQMNEIDPLAIEERIAALQQRHVRVVNLSYAGQEIAFMQRVLGDTPAVMLLDICKWKLAEEAHDE